MGRQLLKNLSKKVGKFLDKVGKIMYTIYVNKKIKNFKEIKVMKSIFVFATIISYLSQPEVDNFNHALFRIKDLGFSE